MKRRFFEWEKKKVCESKFASLNKTEGKLFYLAAGGEKEGGNEDKARGGKLGEEMIAEILFHLLSQLRVLLEQTSILFLAHLCSKLTPKLLE